ncbi:MAG: nucleotide exchange factor GrpE [Bacteroidaceae bacterium]|nr:nucleotide exchange factor GrpE [Bacteroidaceae bacterium]
MKKNRKTVNKMADQEDEMKQEKPECGQEQQEEQNQENSLEVQLEQANAQCTELQDRLLRQMAEFDNFRKRTIKEKAELIVNGSAGIVTDILPVIDDLERAVSNSRKADDYNALCEGIELIYNKLMHILKQKGVKKISPKNEPFDVDFHEAIAMIPAPDEQSKGMVLDCAIDGYMLNDKVLRHAKVAVGQ